MADYTIQSTVTLVRNDEGENVYRIDATVLRDGVPLKNFIQDVGVDAYDQAETFRFMRHRFLQIVDEDNDRRERSTLQSRAAALQDALNAWSRTVP